MIVSTRAIGRRVRAGKPRFQAVVQDPTGQLRVTWFNSLYLRDKLHPGIHVRLQGKVDRRRGEPHMVNPRWEVVDEQTPPRTVEARWRPVYPATEDLPSYAIESLIQDLLTSVLPLIVDPLSPAHLERPASMLNDD